MTLSISALADQFFAFMNSRNAVGTIGYYRRHIERFAAAVNNIDVGQLRKHHLIGNCKSWHAMQAVQRLFHWAHYEMELIDRNPFKGIKRPRPGRRHRVLTGVEAAQVLRGADRVFRPVLIALRESIARPQEMRVVTWEMIRWEGQHKTALEALRAGDAFFELWEYKSRKQRSDPDAPRVILINARLSRLLIRSLRRPGKRTGSIFLNRHGKAFTSNAIRLRVRRLCRRLGIEADARGERVVAYTLRHTSATNACASGMPDRILADLMGHTTTRTTARYQHLSRRHLRNAVDKLERPNKSKGPMPE